MRSLLKFNITSRGFQLIPFQPYSNPASSFELYVRSRAQEEIFTHSKLPVLSTGNQSLIHKDPCTISQEYNGLQILHITCFQSASTYYFTPLQTQIKEIILVCSIFKQQGILSNVHIFLPFKYYSILHSLLPCNLYSKRGRPA
uniref:Uncharacterized protein n=1 Tax=Sphaerodactylus townsendi TaxID=933632 RepID=A0ACB8EB44_9SAUR